MWLIKYHPWKRCKAERKIGEIYAKRAKAAPLTGGWQFEQISGRVTAEPENSRGGPLPGLAQHPRYGWPERLSQTAQPGGSDDRELPAEPEKRTVRAARKRPISHSRTDHSGRHVDVDDSRIGQRHIRTLSPKQEKVLAPRINRGEVRL